MRLAGTLDDDEDLRAVHPWRGVANTSVIDTEMTLARGERGHPCAQQWPCEQQPAQQRPPRTSRVCQAGKSWPLAAWHTHKQKGTVNAIACRDRNEELTVTETREQPGATKRTHHRLKSDDPWLVLLVGCLTCMCVCMISRSRDSRWTERLMPDAQEQNRKLCLKLCNFSSSGRGATKK